MHAAGQNGNGWRGRMQEMIIFPTDQNAAGNRTGIENNINFFYDIY
jgi:hypothetical protein